MHTKFSSEYMRQKRRLWIGRLIWEDNIKMELKKIRREAWSVFS
jgi:hypothetical protein